MATSADIAVAPVKQISGGPPLMMTLNEGGSVTAKTGEWAKRTNGLVVEGADNDPLILGFFAEDAHNATSDTKTAKVYVATGDQIFKGNLKGASGANRAGKQADIGQSFPLYRDTTNSKVFIDGSAKTNMRVMVVDVDPSNPITDTNPVVHFMVLPGNREFEATS